MTLITRHSGAEEDTSSCAPQNPALPLTCRDHGVHKWWLLLRLLLLGCMELNTPPRKGTPQIGRHLSPRTSQLAWKLTKWEYRTQWMRSCVCQYRRLSQKSGKHKISIRFRSVSRPKMWVSRHGSFHSPLMTIATRTLRLSRKTMHSQMGVGKSLAASPATQLMHLPTQPVTVRRQ